MMEKFKSNEKGQVMLLTILLIGGTILAATILAGTLMLYQIRQTTLAVSSNKAIFAADAGIELSLYRLLKDPNYPTSTFSNGANFNIAVESTDGMITGIKSIGMAGEASRAFRLFLGIPASTSSAP